MKRFPIRSVAGSLMAVMCLLGNGGTPAQADVMLGINFNAYPDRRGATVAPAETAGAVTQQNWNNAMLPGPTPATDATDDGAGHVSFSNSTSGISLIDSNGAAYPAITYSITGGYPGGNASAPWSAWGVASISGGTAGDRHLMQGGLQTRNNLGTIVLNSVHAFTGSVSYDLYVYYTPRDGTSTVNLLNTLNVYQDNNPVAFGTYTITSIPFTGNGYVQSNGSGGTGNYLKITGLTADTLKLTDLGQDWTNSVAGIQIVPIPEPATLGLLAIPGVGGLMMRSRRHK
ncbi:MAG: hypothetical protein WC058_10580 [Phycisphaeraceae bacterium]